MELQQHVHMFFSLEQQTLHVTLPRQRLNFSVLNRHSTINSLDFPNFSVSQPQSLRILIGLESGLVLQYDNVLKFIVPHCRNLNFSSQSGHPQVSTDLNNLANPPCFAYDVDEYLRQLKPPANMTASLYLALLHARTSHPLVDPFTQLTGQEMALVILNRASSFSCSPLDSLQLNILNIVKQCCPSRNLDSLRGGRHASYRRYELKHFLRQCPIRCALWSHSKSLLTKSFHTVRS